MLKLLRIDVKGAVEARHGGPVAQERFDWIRVGNGRIRVFCDLIVEADFKRRLLVSRQSGLQRRCLHHELDRPELAGALLAAKRALQDGVLQQGVHFGLNALHIRDTHKPADDADIRSFVLNALMLQASRAQALEQGHEGDSRRPDGRDANELFDVFVAVVEVLVVFLTSA